MCVSITGARANLPPSNIPCVFDVLLVSENHSGSILLESSLSLEFDTKPPISGASSVCKPSYTPTSCRVSSVMSCRHFFTFFVCVKKLS